MVQMPICFNCKIPVRIFTQMNHNYTILRVYSGPSLQVFVTVECTKIWSTDPMTLKLKRMTPKILVCIHQFGSEFHNNDGKIIGYLNLYFENRFLLKKNLSYFNFDQ